MSQILFKNCLAILKNTHSKMETSADLLIEGTKIKKVGKNLTASKDARVIDGRNLVIIPGLVNTHHHFFQTLTRNLPEVQNAKLFDWLVFLYEIWKNIDMEGVYYSSLLAIGELLKTGCTTSTDHHYLYSSAMDGDVMQTQFEAAEKLGMRFSPTRGSMSLSKKDGGLPPDSVVQSVDKILEDSERCIKKFHDKAPDAMRKIVLAPCSPFSVTKECMKESSHLARQYGVRLHTHLCETIDEENDCKKMYGVRPLKLMEECDLIGDDVFYAHGIWFNDEELKLLAKTKTSIAHCPNSNMRLGSGICRVKEMLDMGINVGIAVDGSASNDSSDMLGELRSALFLQRVKYGSNALTAMDVYKMGTVNGANLLGFKGAVGELNEGWCADLAAFDVSSLGYAGSQSDPVASLIFSGDSHLAKYTVVNGRVVVDDGRLVGFDEEKLFNKANEIANKLYKK